WQFRTGAVVTSTPAVARIELGGLSQVAIAYFTSWDGNVYAVRVRDGTELWRFHTDDQPGAGYPGASSVAVRRVAGRLRVFAATGETMYSLDAVTGAESWRFHAGTGCVDAHGAPPGLCAFTGERNEIESSPVVAGGAVYFGADTNDCCGKGGFYAVDALTGA